LCEKVQFDKKETAVCHLQPKLFTLLLFLVKCSYSEIAQRIFKYSDMQHTSLTPDDALNSLIYGTLLYINIYGSYKLWKTLKYKLALWHHKTTADYDGWNNATGDVVKVLNKLSVNGTARHVCDVVITDQLLHNYCQILLVRQSSVLRDDLLQLLH